MKKCSECELEIKDNEKVLILDDGRGFCSECYEAKPYTAYVYQDKYGNFLGISDNISERKYDKEFGDFY